MTDPDAYCRELEAYLCRKNDGHLVRIVGPAFERVRGWATQGVPMRIACAGIDRYFERYYRRGPRRRPIRIEFCEADVLDAFDDWRRAVGVAAVAGGEPGEPGEEAPIAVRRRASLAGHVEEALARLTALRAGDRPLPDDLLEGVVRKLDHLLSAARQARGETRASVLHTLAELDTVLADGAAAVLGDAARAEISAEVEQELAPFKPRMTAEAYAEAVRAARQRLVRERFRLPKLRFD